MYRPTQTKALLFILVLAVGLGLPCVLAAAACGRSDGGAASVPTAIPPHDQTQATSFSGTIEIDGSSTVFPIAEAVAEEFHKLHPDVQVNVGVSGTGGGFKRFGAGETDISSASRPIKQAEADEAAKNGVEFVELKIAIDGLSVMVNPANDFVDCLTVAELKAIWSPDSTISNWKDIRPDFPDQRLRLYGPGTDSGTFDYFTEVIVGTARSSRADYTASEDDNVLVQGIAGDKYALGYFGYAYYIENPGKLKAVPVDGGSGCVLPSETTIRAGEYSPLARPLLIYVKKKSLERPEVKAFLQFFIESGKQLVEEVGYIPLTDQEYADNLPLLR